MIPGHCTCTSPLLHGLRQPLTRAIWSGHPGTKKKVRTSLSKILTISKNSQTNMLLLIIGQLRYPEVACGVLSHSVWARLVASKSDEVSHRQIFIAKTCYIVKSQATHPRKEWRGKNRGKSKTRTACCCQRRFGSSRSAPVEQAQKISLLRALSVQKVVL